MLTTCPECRTTFRIGHAQLEARRGLVRCGTCSAVFNAYDTLLPELTAPPGEEPQPGAPPQPEVTGPIEPPPAEAYGGSLAAPIASFPRQRESMEDTEPDASLRWREEVLEAPGDHVEPPVAYPGKAGEPEEPEPAFAPAEVEDIRAEPGPLPALERYEAPEPAAAVRIQDEIAVDRVELSFQGDASGTREQASADEILLSDLPTRQGKAAASPVWKTLLQSLLVLLLVLAFLAQLAYFLRGEIASRQPEARPWLEAACEWVGCRIPLARDLDLLRVEWSSLETDPEQPSQARLRVTLSNRSPAEQAWPYLILKLTDAKNAPLAQRAFAPADYLPRDRKPPDGIRPMSEQEFRVDLDLAALEAAGYEVRLHYP